MPARCDVCGKGPVAGNSISHSHRKTRRRWEPNLHSMRANVKGSLRRVRVCSKCLKAGKVQKVV